ncbi:MAG: aldehyde dehydrogenase [Actinomycetota bacterium]|jgi:aldehyde dehydrogenase (NAD+)
MLSLRQHEGVTTTEHRLDYGPLVDEMRAGFASGLTRPIEWRRSQLRQIQRLLAEGEEELLAALATDLGKPTLEGWAADIGLVSAEIGYLHDHLDKWMRPEKVRVPMIAQPGKATIVPEPLGVALVVAPWNYPVQLAVLPMAAAIAAGNAVVAKPSELAPTVSAALARLVPRYLDQRAVAVVEGAVPETTALLAQRWDHIFYTGNGRVGRVVMAAAAEHLTPVTLELGGKSPVIVDRDANLTVAARRIAWGKFANAGQTCVAPDYALVHEAVADQLLDELTRAVNRFYGGDPRHSPDYGRIVNGSHFRRLSGLIDGGGFERLVFGGDRDEAARYIAPTVLSGVASDAPVMGEEIFGPILAVRTVPDMDAAMAEVNAGDKPLALYAFTESKRTAERIVAGTSSGGVCVNGTVLHLGVPGLPFGGVGESGMGAYHGRTGFDTFSHRKAVLTRPARPDLPVPYPPYRRWKGRVMRRFL